MQEIDARCTTQQAAGGGGGGRGEGGGANQAKPQTDRTPNRTQNQRIKNTTFDKQRTQTRHLAYGKEPNPHDRKHRRNPGGRSHAMYSKAMLRSNASKMIVKSSVVPETKNRKTKNAEQTASNSSRRNQSNSRKQTRRVTACAPTPKRERSRLEENLTPGITFKQPGRFLVGQLVTVQRPLFLGFTEQHRTASYNPRN